MRQNPSNSRYIDGKPMAGYQSSTDRTSMGNDQPLTLSKEVGFFLGDRDRQSQPQYTTNTTGAPAPQSLGGIKSLAI